MCCVPKIKPKRWDHYFIDCAKSIKKNIPCKYFKNSKIYWFFILNVILCNLKYILSIIVKRSFGILKVYWQQFFLFTSQCNLVGQLLIHIQKGSACLPGLASLSPSDAWQVYRSVYSSLTGSLWCNLIKLSSLNSWNIFEF